MNNTLRTTFVPRRMGWRAALHPAYAAGLAIALGSTVPARAQSFTITSLGSLGGDSQANALSLTGAAAGTSLLADGTTNRAFLTPLGGSPQSLGTLGGVNSYGTGITSGAATRIVGYSDTGSGATQHAFLYTAGGTGGVATNPQMQDLGALGLSSYNSQAYGINALGQVVGLSRVNAAGAQHAFRTGVGSTAINPATDDLGTLGGTQSSANGINALGQAVGSSTLSGDAATHAFRTAANGTITVTGDLGALGGTNSAAFAINSAGQVVGDAETAGGAADHAFLWTQGATTGVTGNLQMKDLGALATGDFSQATGINTSGQVVGFSDLVSGGSDTHAFLYRNSQLFDLNSLISPASGWILEFAGAINDSGQIAGYGLFQGSERAFLLTPTPEPSSLVVLALGVLGTGALAVRKHRRVSAL